MDQNLKIQLKQIEGKFNIMESMSLSDEEINNGFSKAEKDIIEKAQRANHKYLRKEGDKYIYEESKQGDSKVGELQIAGKVGGGMMASGIINGKKVSIDIPKEFLKTVSSFDNKESRQKVKDMLLTEAGKDQQPEKKEEADSYVKNKKEIISKLEKQIDDLGNEVASLDTDQKLKKVKGILSVHKSELEEYNNKTEKSITDTLSKEQQVATILKSFKDGNLTDSEGNKVDSIEKAVEIAFEKGGEGSRGGKVIGHTDSGKPIYEKANHPSHKSFNRGDHQDAHNLHQKLGKEAENKKDKEKEYFHFQQGSEHRKRSNKDNEE